MLKAAVRLTQLLGNEVFALLQKQFAGRVLYIRRRYPNESLIYLLGDIIEYQIRKVLGGQKIYICKPRLNPDPRVVYELNKEIKPTELMNITHCSRSWAYHIVKQGRLHYG